MKFYEMITLFRDNWVEKSFQDGDIGRMRSRLAEEIELLPKENRSVAIVALFEYECALKQKSYMRGIRDVAEIQRAFGLNWGDELHE